MKIEHPYRGLTGGEWLRGQLHSHTTASDGERPMRQVINDYARRGYDFLMISDHDIHTSAADYKKIDNKGMVLIPGNEVSRNGPHLLHVNSERRVEPDPLRQKVINDINKGRGFAVINHPNWGSTFNHCDQEKLEQWIDYVGIEIFNGVIGRLQGSQFATDRWDMLLTNGRRVWGFANDDSHAAKGDVELGWNMVYTKKRTVAGICDAMRAGKFYGSTGVTIDRIQVRGSTIRIEAADAHRIVAVRGGGGRCAVVDGSAIELEVPPKSKYVRFECYGSGEKVAWTQPFFLKE